MVLPFSPYWHEQTMKTTFANTSCLESSILVSKSWVAFFLLYLKSFGMSAKPRSQPSSLEASCQISMGSPRQPCLHWESKLPHWPKAVTWPKLGKAESLSRECGQWLRASSSVSVGGWNCRRSEGLFVFSSTWKLLLREWKHVTKTKKQRQEGERKVLMAFQVQIPVRSQVLAHFQPSVAWDIPIW